MQLSHWETKLTIRRCYHTARLTMTPDQLKVLDQMRQRLSQLSTSVQTLQSELGRSQPLPAW